MNNQQNQESANGMSLIVKTVTRLSVGLILLYGIYIVLHGHLSPGGGFAGGVIIALSFIHLMLAFGKELVLKKFSEKKAAILEACGASLFLILAVLGISGGYFFYNFITATKANHFLLLGAGTIPLNNIAISLKVGAGLFAIFVSLSLFKRQDKGRG